MKKILGLDLGTNSIGWAVVNEAERGREKSSIVKLGVRTISYDNFVNTATKTESMEPVKDFCGGKSISPNAGRTQKRGARRNLQRYKLRRNFLRKLLKDNHFIDEETILAEKGNNTTFETYRLRAKAATRKISLSEFARVLLMINKKRGYKSNRKTGIKDGGQPIDGMDIAKTLYEKGITPGQYVLNEILDKGKNYAPVFYASDLKAEFDRIWNFQKTFYPKMTDAIKIELEGKPSKNTWAICRDRFGLVGMKRTTKGLDLKKEDYKWRVDALSKKVGLEEMAIVLQNINDQLNAISGYLSAIGDRSKELYFGGQTVGQYQMAELKKNPNYSLKNQIFYRQDYLDEFEKLWETQAKFHQELTPELKKEIRDAVIFYQRPLKSQKGLVSFCEFEHKTIKVTIDGKEKAKTVGLKVCPRSSPLFQEFRIWQNINNLEVNGRQIELEDKKILFNELSIKEKISDRDALKLLFENDKELELNFKAIEGNRTQAKLFSAYQRIISLSGHGEYEFDKMPTNDVMEIVEKVFTGLGYNTKILHFDSGLPDPAFEEQPAYKLWHLLYSFEGDSSKTGNEKLVAKISELCGFEKEYAAILAGLTFEPEYGSLSAKAIRKILPYLKQGFVYSEACEKAGYNHSKRSLTNEQLANKIYKDHLELLPKNSLRNPVVEKILNQMVNVVNAVVDTYGKPDEIRIELSRELKKSKKEREEMAEADSKSAKESEEYKKILQKEFGLINVSRNDITRYRLYRELEGNGYKTLYSNTYISQEKLFGKEFDIEHIIPKAKLFDDTFSNKTLEERGVNIKKSDSTAYDFVSVQYEKELEDYVSRVEKLFKDGAISKTKHDKLLMKEADIPGGFIERDLRDTQYIAKKAREMLEDMVKFVIPTTGSVTARLREDWQLTNAMRELNWDKYEKLGLTEITKGKDGRKIRRIKDWTKRNDHRHHAMDALTIAFTKRSFIQYLNNLHARSDKSSSIYGIEQKELYRDKDNHGKLRFKPPMPLNEFRASAKQELENILISIKAKNKVVTRNINVTQGKDSRGKKLLNRTLQLTPRGQLHNETIYGSIRQPVVKEEKIGSNFTKEHIAAVTSPKYKDALLTRLAQFENNPKKAFTGKNSLDKNPIFLNSLHTDQVPEKVKVASFETVYTIRKEISPDLNVDKVIDKHIQKILKERLAEFDNNPKKAFSNKNENPIWINKEKGISIRRVTITGVKNATALHEKHDLNGNVILDKNGQPIPDDFVSLNNNHHVAVYRDASGKLQEKVVSFFEATGRANKGLPVVNKEFKKDEGWQFLFTMKQNEYFVFPNKKTGFDPAKIDLTDPKNYAKISPNLFRVQKIGSKAYWFRHHLETVVTRDIKDITYKRANLGAIKDIVKVRLNHLGQIVSVGEYVSLDGKVMNTKGFVHELPKKSTDEDKEDRVPKKHFKANDFENVQLILGTLDFVSKDKSMAKAFNTIFSDLTGYDLIKLMKKQGASKFSEGSKVLFKTYYDKLNRCSSTKKAIMQLRNELSLTSSDMQEIASYASKYQK